MADHRHADQGADRDFAAYGDEDWSRTYPWGQPPLPYWEHEGYEYHASYPSAEPRGGWYPGSGARSDPRGSGLPDLYSMAREHGFRGDFNYAARRRALGPKDYRRSDERIREDVSDLLMADPYLDASDIEVRVENAEVTLSGTVASRAEKRLAEYEAEQVAGVVDVHNLLRIRPGDRGGSEETGVQNEGGR